MGFFDVQKILAQTGLIILENEHCLGPEWLPQNCTKQRSFEPALSGSSLIGSQNFTLRRWIIICCCIGSDPETSLLTTRNIHVLTALGAQESQRNFLEGFRLRVCREAVLRCCLGLRSSHGLTGETSASELPVRGSWKTSGVPLPGSHGSLLGTGLSHGSWLPPEREIPRESKRERMVFS